MIIQRWLQFLPNNLTFFKVFLTFSEKSFIFAVYLNRTCHEYSKHDRYDSHYFKTQPVLKAWLFGSYARGEETSDSDVDVLFVPDRSGKPFTLFTMAKMYQDLKKMLDKEVDLVEEGSLRPYASASAEQDKKLIYERAN